MTTITKDQWDEVYDEIFLPKEEDLKPYRELEARDREEQTW